MAGRDEVDRRDHADDIADGLVAFAAGHKATQVVVGAPLGRRPSPFSSGLVPQVIRRARELDVHVVPSHPAPTRSAPVTQRSGLRLRVDSPLPPRQRRAAWIAAAALSVLAYAPFVPGIVALMGLEATQQATGVTTLSWLVTEALRSLFAGTGMPALRRTCFDSCSESVYDIWAGSIPD